MQSTHKMIGLGLQNDTKLGNQMLDAMEHIILVEKILWIPIHGRIEVKG